jgi:RNA polymerase sigma-70 factor, ECF subfamily
MLIDDEARGARPCEWFESLFHAYHAPLCGFVYRYVASAEAAEDVVQDLFLAIWRSREQWMSKGDEIKPAMYVAARNRALDYLKYGAVRTRHSAMVSRAERERPAASPEDELLYTELMTELTEAVARLPERCRLVFSLSRDSHLSNSEIAAMMGVSVKTVEAQITRALRALRSALVPHLASLLLAAAALPLVGLG